MQLFIKIDLVEPLCLPIAYKSLVQGAIYALLRDESDFSQKLHDGDTTSSHRSFKHFCFGDLRGRCTIKNKEITFQQSVQFEIRSLNEELIYRLEHAISLYGIRLGKYQLYPEIIRRVNYRVKKPSVKIEMLSPMTLYQTDHDTRYTEYFNPLDKTFGQLLNDNFIRKYRAAYEQEPKGTIELKVLNISSRDQCVTTFKGTIIKAWYGDYLLSGEVKDLDFLFNTGLGSKNSQGFGLFRLIN